jgi:hypothetical protein
MVKGSKGIEASCGDSENDGLGTREAHHVSVSPQEDRGGAAGEMGAGEGGEEESGVAVLVTSRASFQVRCRTQGQIELPQRVLPRS